MVDFFVLFRFPDFLPNFNRFSYFTRGGTFCNKKWSTITVTQQQASSLRSVSSVPARCAWIVAGSRIVKRTLTGRPTLQTAPTCRHFVAFCTRVSRWSSTRRRPFNTVSGSTAGEVLHQVHISAEHVKAHGADGEQLPFAGDARHLKLQLCCCKSCVHCQKSASCTFPGTDLLLPLLQTGQSLVFLLHIIVDGCCSFSRKGLHLPSILFLIGVTNVRAAKWNDCVLWKTNQNISQKISLLIFFAFFGSQISCQILKNRFSNKYLVLYKSIFLLGKNVIT